MPKEAIKTGSWKKKDVQNASKGGFGGIKIEGLTLDCVIKKSKRKKGGGIKKGKVKNRE